MIEDRALALAGILQASHLVTKVARTGLLPQDSYDSCIESLFIFDAKTTADIYGGIQGLSTGLKITHEVLTRLNIKDYGETLRYCLSLLNLERRLATTESNLLKEIAERLANIKRSRPDSPADEGIVREIACIYSDTISQLGRRIKVNGEMRLLQNERNADKVRALLMSGIRSAVLFHQLGGRRWHLIVQRGRLKRAIIQLKRG